MLNTVVVILQNNCIYFNMKNNLVTVPLQFRMCHLLHSVCLHAIDPTES